MGQTPEVHHLQLQPGRNVRGTVVYPDGTKLGVPLAGSLFREGTEVSRSGLEEWQGLPFGHYLVRIPSTG